MSRFRVSGTRVECLLIYWRSTIRLDDERVLSSQELANLVGTSDAQTKKDLVYFGEFKIPGQGIG